MNLIVLSREPPVPEMARLVGEQRITRIEWEALRFTPEESGAMTAAAISSPSSRRPSTARATAGPPASC